MQRHLIECQRDTALTIDNLVHCLPLLSLSIPGSSSKLDTGLLMGAVHLWGHWNLGYDHFSFDIWGVNAGDKSGEVEGSVCW